MLKRRIDIATTNYWKLDIDYSMSFFYFYFILLIGDLMNFRELKTLKFSVIYNRKIDVYNYKSINFLSDEKITIDSLNIYGDDLKVVSIDGYKITIKGILKRVDLDEIFS